LLISVPRPPVRSKSCAARIGSDGAVVCRGHAQLSGLNGLN
jgi:hypothetical protein